MAKKKDEDLKTNSTALQVKLKYKEVWRYHFIHGMTKTDAYIKAYPESKVNRRSAASMAWRICAEIDKECRAELKTVMDAAGLDYVCLAQEIKKGLNAKKCVFFQGQPTMIKNKKGEPTKKPMLFDDNTTQQKARELLAKVLGIFKDGDDKPDLPASGNTNIYFLDAELIEMVKRIFKGNEQARNSRLLPEDSE